MKYTLLPTFPQPWYRIEAPWQEYLQLHRAMRDKGDQRLMGLVNHNMRQTGDGRAVIHLEHAEFEALQGLKPLPTKENDHV